ncbi:ABC transporter permease subunit [Streptomyces sp. TRM 70361]|uniref:ABC transporter permease subunit n=1 Tax=Streptomyces sp. TRM 70361 TaxID=3116553 RepID=UPI002E7B06CC|nr:ABC transporter permease subunit [Streptomyces sp. TRM 70361]MEE1940379.1 ABC transporter permease subunit [Streptomyces sp. TRM 70361]
MSAEPLAVFGKALRDQRRGLTFWAAGLALVTLMYTSSFDPDRASEDPSGFQKALAFDDLATGPGFLRATVLGMIVPLLLLAYATITGSKSVAGEEETGLLDLYLAQPIDRGRLLVQRFAATCLAVAGFSLIVLLELALLSSALDMGVAFGNLLVTVVGLAFLVITFAAVAFATGAITGRRTLTLGVTAGYGAFSFVINALASQSEAIEPLKYLSAFHYYLGGSPLREGFDPAMLVLVVAPAVLFGAGLARFRNRDLNV